MPIKRQPNDDWDFVPNTKKDWFQVICYSLSLAFGLFGFYYVTKFLLGYFFG
jgi:hypothetical protein